MTCSRPCHACREIAAGGRSPGPHADEIGEAIPPPPDVAERAAWERDQRALAADPRTAGSANRPARLVAQVLGDAQHCRDCGGWGRHPKCTTCGQVVTVHPDDGIDGDELGQ